MSRDTSSKGMTARAKDYAQWYLDVIAAADLAEHSDIKGSMIIKPYGYAIWENMQKVLDERIKATGHQNAYFPLLIPESYLRKEKEHVEGFSPELAVVTHAGGQKLDEPLVVRPTSETVINAAFARWIQSWRDLPMLINQWANVVRWELRPRLFLRTTEFLWQEGHTAHRSEAEAEEEARRMLEEYRKFMEEYLAIPVAVGEKTALERFAGALRTYTIEALMPDGKALQMGTSHNLGQNFAKVFGVKFLDKDNKEKFVWQTSWGVSTRMIGGLIMAHSDDKGLVLPPKIAPTHVVIIPIFKSADEKKKVIDLAQGTEKKLTAKGVHVVVDLQDAQTLGAKIYQWEKKGVPMRIEIGPKDVEQRRVIAARRDQEKKAAVDAAQIVGYVIDELESMQRDLFAAALQRLKENSSFVERYDVFKKAVEKGGFVYAPWAGTTADELKIKAETKATIRCIPFKSPYSGGICMTTGKKTQTVAVFARAY